MSKFIDLTGLSFGNFKAIKIAGKNKYNLILWECLCDCGNISIVTGSNLRNGNTKSCGCLKNKLLFINRKNKRYGKLVAVEKIGENKFRDSIWKCICDCGKEITALGSSLTTGNTISCGCYNKEQSHKKHFQDLKNKIFNQLTVVSFYKIDKGVTFWNCVCSCGKETIANGGSLKNGSVKSCGCLSGQSFLASELKKYFIEEYNAISEYKILKNTNTNAWLPYDIYIPKYKIFIEINGLQHYEFNKHWHKTIEQFEYNKKIDRIKRKFARQNGIYIEIDLRKIKTVKKAVFYIENKGELLIE